MADSALLPGLGVIGVTRKSYAKKLQKRFSANYPASVSKGLKCITNYKTKSPSIGSNKHLANELNISYCRLDTSDQTAHTISLHSHQHLQPSPSLPLHFRSVRIMCVRSSVNKRRKAPVPHGVSPACPRTCAELLVPIFNRSLEQRKSPSCLKHSTLST